MVISRAAAPCQMREESLTRMAAPPASEARKVIMATIVASARPAIEASGTSGVSLCLARLHPEMLRVRLTGASTWLTRKYAAGHRRERAFLRRRIDP